MGLGSDHPVPRCFSYPPSGNDRNVIDPGTEPADTPDNFLRRSPTTLLRSDQLFLVTAVSDGL